MTAELACEAINAEEVEQVFNSSFLKAENTCLLGGGEEPIYLPADAENAHNRVIYTRDYVSSALHEVAHWCIAGAERRSQVDYGYWYTPDGRDREQQARFERVEVAPQALESIFSAALGIRFRPSADNLESNEGSELELMRFAAEIADMSDKFRAEGLPPRAQEFLLALQEHVKNRSYSRA